MGQRKTTESTFSRHPLAHARGAVRERCSSVLLRYNGLRQRTRRILVWIAGEIARIVRRRQRVVRVDDRGLPVLWIDRDLEQVEQITSPLTTA